MDRDNNLGCLEIEIFSLYSRSDVSCVRLTNEIELTAFSLVSRYEISCDRLTDRLDLSLKSITNPLQVSCFQICSVTKTPYWMWDAGEILLWDNNKKIELESWLQME